MRSGSGWRTEFDLLSDTGHDAAADKFSGRVYAVETARTGSNGRYKTDTPAEQHIESANLEAEKHISECRKLDNFKGESVQGIEEDDRLTKGTRSELNPVPLVDQIDGVLRELERMEEVRKEYRAQKDEDRAALRKTGAIDLELTPMPPQFQASDLVDDIDIDVDGKLKDAEVQRVADEAGQKLAAILTDENTAQSVLLDLMAKSEERLRADLGKSLFPGLKFVDISEKQQHLVSKLAAEMYDKINKEAPNRVSADADRCDGMRVGARHR